MATSENTLCEIKVPELGESITEAIVAKIMLQTGQAVTADTLLLELETDKVSVEILSPQPGVLKEIRVKEGDTVNIGDVVAVVTVGAAATVDPTASANDKKKTEPETRVKQSEADTAPKQQQPTEQPMEQPMEQPAVKADDAGYTKAGPAARRALAEHDVNPSAVSPSAPRQTMTPEDVTKASRQSMPRPSTVAIFEKTYERKTDPRGEKVVPMSRLRMRIAERLKGAQNTAALLTTVNEIDMHRLIEMRQSHREIFENRHQVRLGFMSFFVSATTIALKDFPVVNAEIYGKSVVYKDFYDIGIAVGTPQGLVVPILRDTDKASFADVEKRVVDFGKRAREGRLSVADMTGGTFTITNGGIYGSLLSTPIVNPPQSAILGLHKIMKRPVVLPDDTIAVRPMMYVALTYDHRLIDGKEAVSFLVRIKELIEDPNLILLE